MISQVATEEGNSCGYTIDDALDAIGFGQFQWRLLLLSAFGYFSYFVQVLMIPIIGAKMSMQWPELMEMNQKKGEFLNTSFAVGQLMGALIYGFIADRMGRRMVFLSVSIVAAFMSVFAAFAPSYWFFVAARYILALAIGGGVVVDFTNFCEFVPTRSRGIYIVSILFLGSCAAFYIKLVEQYFQEYSWNVIVMICNMPCLATMVGHLFWSWESPRYLISQGRVVAATSVLTEMAIVNNASLPQGKLCSTNLSNASSNTTSMAEFWQSGILCTMAAVGGIWFLDSIGRFGYFRWIVMLYMEKKLQSFTAPPLLLESAGLIGYLATFFLIDGLGRKGSLIFYFSGFAASSCLFIFVTDSDMFIMIRCLNAFFSTATNAAIFVISVESFPTPFRASSFGISYAFGKLAQILAPRLFSFFLEKTSASANLVATVFCFLIGILIAAFFVNEGSGERLSDSIEDSYSTKTTAYF